jgi:hypothetical protein
VSKGNIKIDSPKNGDKITSTFLVTRGHVEGGDCGLITGKLKQGNDVKYTQHPLTPIGQYPWVIQFDDVAKGDFYLEVTGVGANPDTIKISMNPKKQAPVRFGIFRLVVTDPPDPNPPKPIIYPHDFTVSGTSDLAFPVSGQIGGNALGTFFGTTLQGPPQDSNWTIQFTGIPTGNGYTITVSDTSGAGVQITPVNVVDSSASK